MDNRHNVRSTIAVTVIAGLLVIGLGFGVLKFLSSMRTPPPQVAVEERALAAC